MTRMPMTRPARASAPRADQHRGRGGRKPLSLSVILAVEAADADRLAATLAPMDSAGRRGIELEIILVGPDDADVLSHVAAQADARLLAEPGSRGRRLQAGARAATGEWLLFLRPETLLDRGWDATIVVFASDPDNRDRAATFTLTPIGRTEDVVRQARIARRRNRWLGLPDGRQGFLIRKRTLAHLGGVPDLRSGEDLALARMMGKGRIALFDVAARVEAAEVPPPWRKRLQVALAALGLPVRWLQGLGE